jgi:protein tyrosine/serine phosphatase
MKSRATMVLVVALASGGVFALLSCSRPLPLTERPSTWAKPAAHDGLPNLHQVSPALYRGGQPSREGLQQLPQLGVRTVINARGEDSEPDPVPPGLQYSCIPMSPWSVNDDQTVAFLRIATDPSRTPVFVHCKNGADRSGVLCAMYRIVVQGWTKDEAIDEMTRNGMGYHNLYYGLLEYIRQADIAKIRQAAGVPLAKQ